MNRQSLRSAANTAFAQAASNPAMAQVAQTTQNGQAVVKSADRVLYVTMEVKGGSDEAFKIISKKETGVTNFDKDALPLMHNAIVDGAALEYGTLPIANDGEFTKVVQSVDFSAEAPAFILNSDFSFSVDDKRIIDLPGYELHNRNTTRVNDEKFRSIGDTPIIVSQKPCKFQIETPGAANLDTSTVRHFVRFSLRTFTTVQR